VVFDDMISALAPSGIGFAPVVLFLSGQSWSGGNTLQVIALVLCLVLSSFANGAETALTSVGRVRSNTMLDQGVKGGEAVAYLIREPNRFLSAILIVNSVAVIVASTLATLLMVSVFGDAAGAIAAPFVTSIVVLVFVEILPKTIAIHTAEATALRYAEPVRFVTRILGPLITVLIGLTGMAMRVRGIPPRSGPFVTEEELISLVTLSEQQGVLQEEEREMIHGVIELENTMVREVMVPRVRITAVQADSTVAEAVGIALEDGHSRLPVFDETIDRVSGVLYVKDLLRAISRGDNEAPIRALARKPFEVPETKRVSDLFREFQTRKIHIAIVVDESGGTAGLVTIEDLLEEIVGDIQDEYDKPGEEPTVERIGPYEFIVDARIHLEDLNDEVHLGIDSDEYDTLNGFIIDRLGAIPAVGSEVRIDGGAVLTVLSVFGRRADKVRITKPETKAATPAAGPGEQQHDQN
jgi:putative hemolysin